MLAVSTTRKQVRFLQDGEVVRHGGFGHVEALGEVASRHLAATQEAENLAAGGVGDGLERFVGGRGHS